MEIDIRKIKTYVISLHDAKEKKEKIKNVLSHLAFTNWSFFDAIDVRNRFPYWIGCGLSHKELLENATYPCIVLEDDVNATEWFYPFNDLPDDGITYLGLSSWGLKNGTSQHMGAVFENYSEKLCLTKYMTGAHAIYYSSKNVAEYFYKGIIKHMFETQKPFDEYYANMQLKQKTYAIKQPLFYQQCPNNTQFTYFKIG